MRVITFGQCICLYHFLRVIRQTVKLVRDVWPALVSTTGILPFNVDSNPLSSDALTSCENTNQVIGAFGKCVE
jgi:hypothetical protein